MLKLLRLDNFNKYEQEFLMPDEPKKLKTWSPEKE